MLTAPNFLCLTAGSLPQIVVALLLVFFRYIALGVETGRVLDYCFRPVSTVRWINLSKAETTALEAKLKRFV